MDFSNTQTANSLCPKYGKENPREAVMCWVCYVPLNAKNGQPIRVPPTPPTKFTADSFLGFCAMGGLVGLGFLPRLIRPYVIGAKSVLFDARPYLEFWIKELWVKSP